MGPKHSVPVETNINRVVRITGGNLSGTSQQHFSGTFGWREYCYCQLKYSKQALTDTTFSKVVSTAELIRMKFARKIRIEFELNLKNFY